MNDEIKRFKQQSWHEQLDVTIHRGGIVKVDNSEVVTPREIALANIILRLNAGMILLKEEIQKLKEKH